LEGAHTLQLLPVWPLDKRHILWEESRSTFVDTTPETA
jgi:hypothetical protein